MRNLAAPGLAVIAAIAVNLVHGAHGGLAFFFGWGRPISWLATLVLLGAALGLIGLTVNQRWDGIFIDGRNKISLSRTQIICWSMLLISALFTAGLSNAAALVAQPLKITIPATIWSLLALGSFTAVASPMILEKKKVQGARPANMAAIEATLARREGLTQPLKPNGSVVEKGTPADARWIDLVLGDEGDAASVDVSKVQKLAFTVLLLAVYGAGLFSTFSAAGVVDRFPEVDPGFVALLGVSHAAYLAYKMTPKEK
jgi:hypothetical protein